MSVDNPRDVPEQYRPLFDKRGIDFTYRALHRKVEGVGLNSVVRALTGQGRLSDRVAEGVSAALGVTPNELHALRGHPIAEPFQLPVRASELNQRERDAVLGIVHALLDARDRHDQADQSSPDSADPTPASRAQGTQAQKIKPADLSERRSRREAGSSVPSDLTPDDVRDESPEDAIAARTRDPRFAPDDPAGYYGTNDIGEESQDPEDHE